MTRYGSIYIATNKHTGEQYVGQTRQSVQKRWAAHWRTAICSASRKAKFQIALTKFGQDAFDVNEMFVAFDAESLNQAEISLIAELQPAYNASKGGKGLRPVAVTEETKRKRSEAAKLRWANPDWRAKTMQSIQLAGQTPEAAARGKKVAAIGNAARWANHEKQEPVKKDKASSIRASWQNCVVRQRRIDGLKAALTKPEVLAKYRSASTGRKHTDSVKIAIARRKRKPVYCHELQCSFLSQNDAAEFFGVAHSAVVQAIKQKGKVGRKFTLVRVA